MQIKATASVHVTGSPIVAVFRSALSWPRSCATTMVSPKSIDEFLSDMDKDPIFMKELPKDVDSNAKLSAIQSLMFEGTPKGMILTID